MNGLLLIDKPTGCTSHDVVGRVRKALKMRQVGHAGTLDPLASGLLVILVGQATKLSDYLLNGDKGYEVVAKLGLQTDTLDLDGKIVEEKEVKATQEQVKSTALEMEGLLELPIPKYSAVKIDGKKLYDYARADEEVEVPKRSSHFFDLEVLSQASDEIEVALNCSKGAYIRAWVNELGRRLESGAAVKELRRTFSAPYKIEEAISLSDFEEIVKEGKEYLFQTSAFISMAETLPDWGEVEVSHQSEKLLLNGQVPRDVSSELLRLYGPTGDQVEGVKLTSASDRKLLAILTAEAQTPFKIRRVFPRT